jgi:hypothetical protein
MLPRRRLQGERHDRRRRAQEGDEGGRGIEPALMGRAEEGREDLWVSAPRALRFPPQTLRITTAGRIACSARQLVASPLPATSFEMVALFGRRGR